VGRVKISRGVFERYGSRSEDIHHRAQGKGSDEFLDQRKP
jgi:hypothetical protein